MRDLLTQPPVYFVMFVCAFSLGWTAKAVEVIWFYRRARRKQEEYIRSLPNFAGKDIEMVWVDTPVGKALQVRYEEPAA